MHILADAPDPYPAPDRPGVRARFCAPGRPIDIRYEAVFSYRVSIGGPPLASSKTDLLRGTLDLLVLQTLTTGENHGLGIARRIAQITQGAFDVRPGSLFPALHRLEEKGWLSSAWGESENNRRARYYRLTAKGRRQLQTETENWGRVSVAIARALRST